MWSWSLVSAYEATDPIVHRLKDFLEGSSSGLPCEIGVLLPAVQALDARRHPLEDTKHPGQALVERAEK